MSNNDLISRTAAINVFMGGPPECYYDNYIVDVLKNLPDVDAEPVRHGYDKSSDYPYCDFKCSVCDKEIKEFWADYKIDYCPFCGAKIDSVIDEDEAAIDNLTHDMRYEPTFNAEDGSM